MAIIPVHNESALLKAVKKGDEKAFEELFMAYHNELGAYVLLLTDSPEMTEEIIQDVFIKVWNNRENIDRIEKFTSFLFILTRNYTLNALRKMVNDQKRQAQYQSHHKYELVYEDQQDSLTEGVDFQVLIDKALVQLPPQQKKVFMLRMQGFKNPEIATEMHISPASVKKYQQWALRSVVKYLRVYEVPPGLIILFQVTAVFF